MTRYRLVDNGIRCFKPPCFSWDVENIATGEKRQVSRLVFQAARSEAMTEKMTNRCYLQPNIVEGNIEGVRDPKGLSHVTLYVEETVADTGV